MSRNKGQLSSSLPSPAQASVRNATWSCTWPQPCISSETSRAFSGTSGRTYDEITAVQVALSGSTNPSKILLASTDSHILITYQPQRPQQNESNLYPLSVILQWLASVNQHASTWNSQDNSASRLIGHILESRSTTVSNNSLSTQR